MPTWVTHITGTSGGFWTGTTTTSADNCSAADKAAINNAFNAFNANSGLNCFVALRDAMRSRWATLSVDCCFDETRPPRGGGLEALVFVCNMTDAQIQVAICTGLAQAASGGNMMDVRAMLFSCFGAPQGIPSASDFNEMLNRPQFGTNANEREGEFVIWNRSTGEVWDKITTTTTTPGGFWSGSTTSTSTSKGARCFVNPSWVI